jgi:hypothetical protein
MNGGHPATRAIGNLAIREDAPQEPFAIPFDGIGNPIDIRRVETHSNDVRHTIASA